VKPTTWPHLVLVVLLAFGTAGFLQAIAERHSVRFDLTPTRSFSISDVSRNVLGTLRDPIEATIFYNRDDYQKLSDLMGLFHGAAPNFHYELLDLDRHPGRAREEGVDRYGKAVLRYHDKKIVVDAAREQSISAGLTLLSRGRPTTVAFLEGHGERALDEVSAPVGYGQLRDALTRESYSISRVNLLKDREVPKDTDLLVVVGPRNDVLDAEASAIDRYLESGGHVMLLIDPVPLPNLERLAARRGIESPLDIVVDRSNQIMGSDPFTILIPTYLSHAITASSSTPALFAVARSVSAGKGPAGVQVASVAASYPDAWAIRDFERAAKPSEPPHPAEDRQGPVPVVAAASWPAGDGEARLVVIGDSDFAANSFLDLLGNRDLVLNSIGWSVSAGELIAARPPSEVVALRPLSPLVLSARTGHAIFLLLVVCEPLLILGLGATVALRRRWRG
jgi:gliding motility-associatede transport system auxiliary component